jgi:hypothetical protein
MRKITLPAVPRVLLALMAGESEATPTICHGARELAAMLASKYAE